jgi:hypothetical protein
MKPLQRRRSNIGPALHPRTEQRIILDQLWDNHDFRLASNLTTHERSGECIDLDLLEVLYYTSVDC